MVSKKQCKKCGEWKILSEFYKKYGIPSSPCKKCRKVYEQLPHVKQRRSNYYNQSEYKKKKRDYQQLPEVKKRRELHNQKPEVKERRRKKHYEYCQRPEIKIRHSKQQHKYHQKPGVKQSRIDKGKEYRKAPRVKKMQKVNDQNRRARKRNLPNTLTKNQWKYALLYWGNSCAVCSVTPQGALHADHWLPISWKNLLNPGTCKENIIPLCPHCNFSKHHNMPDEWLHEKFGVVFAQYILEKIRVYFQIVADRK